MTELNVADEMILAYVPEAEYISFSDALRLALERDVEAAIDLTIDILEFRLEEGLRNLQYGPAKTKNSNIAIN